jgi:hypothetical protein
VTTYALGRHVEHDERSREYPARVTAAKPKTVLWSHQAPVLDQGDLGSCTGNALAQWLNTNYAQAALGEAGHRTGYLIEDNAVELYSAATKLDSISGSYPPDDTGSSGLAVCKAGRKLGYLDAYHHAFGLDALLLALQHSPVIVGTEWTKNMFDPNTAGVIRPTGPVEGGHEYLVLGGDIEHQRLTILNSWSDSWGRDGRAYISFRDFGMLLANQGDVTVPII